MKTKITLFFSAMLMAVLCTVSVHAQNAITFDAPPTEVTAGTNATVKINYTKDDVGAWAQVKLRDASNAEVVSAFVAITEASGSIDFDLAIPGSALGSDYHWWAQIMDASWGGVAVVPEPFPEVTVLAGVVVPVNSITFDAPPTEVTAGTNATVKVNYTKDDAGAWVQVKLRNASNAALAEGLVAITEASGSLDLDIAIPDSALGTGYHWWAQIMDASWGGEATVPEPFPEVTVLAAAIVVYDVTFTVVDADDIAVAGADVLLLETTVTTDASGVAVFTDLDPVTDAAYIVSKDGFDDASGTVSVVDADVDVDVVLTTTVSINNDISMISNIYPNPTNGRLNIELNNSFDKAQVSVYSLQGQIIEQREIFEMHSVLDFSAYKTGIYLIKVELDDQIYSGRIIIE